MLILEVGDENNWGRQVKYCLSDVTAFRVRFVIQRGRVGPKIYSYYATVLHIIIALVQLLLHFIIFLYHTIVLLFRRIFIYVNKIASLSFDQNERLGLKIFYGQFVSPSSTR